MRTFLSGLKSLAVLLLCAVSPGCATWKYNSTTPAKLHNADRIWLVWLGPDEFIYVPDPDVNRRFFIERADGEKITPGVMKTDGGSIPRVFRGSEQLSPWRFTPAFIVHDWLFEMKRCGLEPGGTPDNTNPHHTVKTAADVMAECVKAQMEEHPKIKNVTTLYLMDLAVRNFAGGMWSNGKCDRVEAEQFALANKVLEGVRAREGAPGADEARSPSIFKAQVESDSTVVFQPVSAAEFARARRLGASAPGAAERASDPNLQVLVPVIHVNARLD